MHTAFLKALMSTGFKMPKKHGSILIGIQESFQPQFLETAKKLNELGYQVSIIHVGLGKAITFQPGEYGVMVPETVTVIRRKY